MSRWTLSHTWEVNEDICRSAQAQEFFSHTKFLRREYSNNTEYDYTKKEKEDLAEGESNSREGKSQDDSGTIGPERD